MFEVKRYLFFNGVRAVVFDHEVLAMKSFIKNTCQLSEDKGLGVGDYVKINSNKNTDIKFLKVEFKITNEAELIAYLKLNI